MAAETIMAGGAEVVVAGGVESMTMIPMGGHKVSANPWLIANYPDAYLSMGLTAERLASRFNITREMSDQFSVDSHKKAIAAIEAGKFDDEIVPVPVSFTTPNGSKPKRTEIIFKMDEGPRADTSMEALAALKPAFHAKGTVTAGNSSQMSDGAAAAIVMSAERAKALGLKPLARYVGFATAGYLARRNGTRPGVRHSQSSETRRPEAERYRRNRIERGLRCTVAGGDSAGRTRSRRASMLTAARSRSAIRWAVPEPS